MRLKIKGHLQRLGSSVPPAATIGISIIVATIILSTTAAQSDSKADVATAKAVSISTSLSQLCHAGNDLAALLQSARTVDGLPLCPTAEAIKINPTAAPVQLVSDDHIVSLIRAELARTPVTGSTAPTLSQVIDAVRAVMKENPVLFKGEKGDPGDEASTSEIAQVVASYFRANAEQFRGPAGKDGRDGKDGVAGKDGVNGSNGSNGSNGTYEPQPTVTQTVTPDPVPDQGDSDTTPPTVTQTETQQNTENSTRQRQRGGLGGLLGN